MGAEDSNSIPLIGERTRKIWKRVAIFWVIVSHTINILAFGSSIFVILLEYYMNDNGKILCPHTDWDLAYDYLRKRI